MSHERGDKKVAEEPKEPKEGNRPKRPMLTPLPLAMPAQSFCMKPPRQVQVIAQGAMIGEQAAVRMHGCMDGQRRGGLSTDL
ncbi:hypothetical protein N7456_005908 [Penicillium angulare]|uniref:Uncharacterized protein n=1 Tax=Penicillium angulare TaxID=116970 RepID=A0A9W9FZH2_9EURO|nr:hypothetical protein N7456_005908 [Penicillium angulare]